MEANPGINNSSEVRSSKLKTFLMEIGIVLVLVVVTLVELQYFKVVDLGKFFPKEFAPQSQQVQQKPVSNLVNVPSSTVDPRFQAIKKIQQEVTLIAKNNALHSALFLIEFECRIMSIDTAGGVDKDSNLLYKVRLVVNVGKGKDTSTILYSKESISKVKILDADHNILGFSDLKKGDFITIKTNLGILNQYPNNINESIITKLD